MTTALMTIAAGLLSAAFTLTLYLYIGEIEQ